MRAPERGQWMREADGADRDPGPTLEVRDGRAARRLGGPRLRALLIRLALDPGRAVADRLAGDLWPGTARTRPPRLTRTPSRPWCRGCGAAEPASSSTAQAVTCWLWIPVTWMTQFGGPSARACGPGAGDQEAPPRGRWTCGAGTWWTSMTPRSHKRSPPEELRLAATEDRIEADLALGRGAGRPRLRNWRPRTRSGRLGPVDARAAGRAAGRRARGLRGHPAGPGRTAGVDPSPRWPPCTHPAR
jgi:hypothetical protein